MKWNPKPIWEGEDVFVIGGGPSLRAFRFDRLKPYLTVGCNDAYLLGEEICNICVFGDLKWYMKNKSGLEKFAGLVVTNQPSLHVRSPDWLRTMSRVPNGLSSTGLSWNGNTGAMAINLALILGAQRVFLLGIDLKLHGKKANWHDNHQKKSSTAGWVGPFRRFRAGFRSVAKALPVTFPGKEVINLGPDSTLDIFPKACLDDFVKGDISE